MHRSASRPRPIGCGPAHRCSGPSGRLDRGGRGRGSPLPSGHLGLRQSASALLADRGSRAPPPAASLCFPESKMAGSRQSGPQARVRPLFCALLLSLSHFVRGDGVGGHPGSAGAAGTPGALPHRRFEYKYSFKGPHLVQSDGTVPFWAHAGSKPGPRAGGRVPPRLAPPSLRLLSAALLVRGEGDPRQPLLQVGSGSLGPSTCPPALPVCLPPVCPPLPPSAGLLLDLLGSFRLFWEAFVTYPPKQSLTLASGHHVSPRRHVPRGNVGHSTRGGATRRPAHSPSASFPASPPSPASVAFKNLVLAMVHAPVCARCPLTAPETVHFGFMVTFYVFMWGHSGTLLEGDLEVATLSDLVWPLISPRRLCIGSLCN